MYRRIAAAAALAVAGLTAAAPIASASQTTASAGVSGNEDPRDDGAPVPAGSGNVELLNGLNVLPVQACGLGVAILSGVLDAPDANCGVDNQGSQDGQNVADD